MRILESDFKRTEDHIDSPDGRTDAAQYLGPDQPYLDMTKSSFVATLTPKSTAYLNYNGNDNEKSDGILRESDPTGYVLREYVDVTSPGSVVVEENNVNYVNVSNETHQHKSTSLGNSTHYDQLQFQEECSAKTNNSTPAASTDQSHIGRDCPFGGLPAAHLTLRQATHTGWLIQPRKYLPVKRYYAGVLDGWLLLYSSGEASIRPSSCYALRHCSWTDSQDGNDKYRLTLITDSSATKKKKRNFQMNSPRDLQDWVIAFTETKPAACLNLFGTRKLPTPPPIQIESNLPTSQSVESISESSTASTISLEADPNKPISDPTMTSPKTENKPRQKVEEIYEEPVELLASLNRLKRQQMTTPPAIVVSQEYDIPKPHPRPVNPPVPLPSVTESPPTITEPSKVADSFEEIKSKVAAQLLANNNPNQSPIRVKSESPNNDATPARRRRSDMRSWLYRISRRGRRSFIHVVTKSASRNPINSSKKDLRIEEESAIGVDEAASENTSQSRKGGKVNQIINQLEANGHRAPMFRMAINRTKGSKWGGGGSKKPSMGDEHNYEPVAVVTAS